MDFLIEKPENYDIGYFLGYRSWQPIMKNDGLKNEGFFIASVWNTEEKIWPKKERYVAQCVGTSFPPPAHRNSPAPYKPCACGIYSYKEPKHAITHPGGMAYHMNLPLVLDVSVATWPQKEMGAVDRIEKAVRITIHVKDRVTDQTAAYDRLLTSREMEEFPDILYQVLSGAIPNFNIVNIKKANKYPSFDTPVLSRLKADWASLLSDESVSQPLKMDKNNYVVFASPKQKVEDFLYALGIVANWGRVIEYSKGYRAQYAYPQAMLIFANNEELSFVASKEIEKDYGITAIPVGPDFFRTDWYQSKVTEWLISQAEKIYRGKDGANRGS